MNPPLMLFARNNYPPLLNPARSLPSLITASLYLKAFLLDSSININEWGVTPSSLKKNINTFIGKPLVLTEDYSHPVPKQADSLAHWLSYQEDYRIGTIVDVVPKDSAYYALIEVTDPDAKKAIEGGAIPNYVSPAIAQTLDGSPAEAMKEWTGVHLAIVDEPAFTVKKATITASCGGDSEQCLLQLRKAKIEKTGIRHGCGFCNYKALIALTSHNTLKDNFNLVKLEDSITNKTEISKPIGQKPILHLHRRQFQKHSTMNW